MRTTVNCQLLLRSMQAARSSLPPSLPSRLPLRRLPLVQQQATLRLQPLTRLTLQPRKSQEVPFWMDSSVRSSLTIPSLMPLRPGVGSQPPQAPTTRRNLSGSKATERKISSPTSTTTISTSIVCLSRQPSPRVASSLIVPCKTPSLALKIPAGSATSFTRVTKLSHVKFLRKNSASNSAWAGTRATT